MAELEINNTEELNEKLNEIAKDPSLNKPTEEETAQAKEEFEKASKKWAETLYKIGEPKDAQEICDYILLFLEKRFLWQKDAWMGVIKLTEELKAAEATFKGKKNKSLEMGYQALEFVYYILSNPGGIGLQSALDFEEEREMFVKVALLVEEQLEGARKALKEVEFLQQRWGAMSQGFYLEVEPGPEDEENPEPEEKSEEKKSEDK